MRLYNKNMENITTIPFTFNSIFSDIVICGAGYQQFSGSESTGSDPKFNKDFHMGAFNRYSLHLIVSGQGRYELNGEVHHLKKGQMFALFTQRDAVYYPNKKYPWKYYWIDFLGVKSEPLLNQLGFTPDSPFLDAGECYKTLEKLFLSNIIVCKNNPKIANEHSLSTLLRIYCELLKKKEQPPPANTAHQSYTQKAMSYVQQHYSDPNLSLKLVAAQLNINEAYLSRQFHAELNINFVDYLKKVRIHAAVGLMNGGSTIVCEIAAACGFSDPYYFSKVFKKYNSITPREHIKMCMDARNREK